VPTFRLFACHQYHTNLELHAQGHSKGRRGGGRMSTGATKSVGLKTKGMRIFPGILKVSCNNGWKKRGWICISCPSSNDRV